ncbi:hypothetical protein CATYP_10645 (plasmid) [Corynebacterium atypicum]|uniref:Uncharacterized protein n=1 Tax=Corynebacterium atypicum TaxID=191610 RepID=A0ABM5QQD6_9CORY|nr:hypothetical protein CATYP_09715 [Corynebacterium atypicum]AIG64924.1 hypothetical protein CATYP_10645 [Corynebacterium atypicum]
MLLDWAWLFAWCFELDENGPAVHQAYPVRYATGSRADELPAQAARGFNDVLEFRFNYVFVHGHSLSSLSGVTAGDESFLTFYIEKYTM